MPATQSGSPMTYTVNGRQFIVVAVSGGPYSGEYIAFAAAAVGRARELRMIRQGEHEEITAAHFGKVQMGFGGLCTVFRGNSCSVDDGGSAGHGWRCHGAV